MNATRLALLLAISRSPQGEHGMFLFLTVQGGFVHADIRFNFKNCYAIVKNSRIK